MLITNCTYNFIKILHFVKTLYLYLYHTMIVYVYITLYQYVHLCTYNIKRKTITYK